MSIRNRSVGETARIALVSAFCVGVEFLLRVVVGSPLGWIQLSPSVCLWGVAVLVTEHILLESTMGYSIVISEEQSPSRVGIPFVRFVPTLAPPEVPVMPDKYKLWSIGAVLLWGFALYLSEELVRATECGLHWGTMVYVGLGILWLLAGFVASLAVLALLRR